MRRALAVVVATVALLAIGVAPASAHNYLVDSNPVDGGTITELPESFSVTTNEALLDLGSDGAGFAIEVIDADGEYYGDGCVTVDGATMSAGSSLGQAGDYRMLWQLVSADGHTVSGELGFTWEPGADAVLSEGSATPPDCGGTGASAPVATGEPVERGNANLTDVLWIGGTILAVLLAAGIAFVVLTRKKSA